MIVEYDISCFGRTLRIKFPDGYEQFKDEILKMLDEYYLYWHDAENITDPDERFAVEEACLEDYMMDRLSETYNMWQRWDSIPYGLEEREGLWVCEHCLMAIESREGSQTIHKHYVDEDDAFESECGLCKEHGFDALYELI